MKKNRYDQDNWEVNTHFGLRCATIFIFFNKFRFLLWKSKNKFCHPFNVSIISVPYYLEKKSIFVLEFPDQSNLREESFVLANGWKVHSVMENYTMKAGAWAIIVSSQDTGVMNSFTLFSFSLLSSSGHSP